MPFTGLTPAESHAKIISQRAAQLVAKMHASFDPVYAYVIQMAKLHGEKHNVLEVPPESSAYGMGYRYFAVPRDEVERHLANGVLDAI